MTADLGAFAGTALAVVFAGAAAGKLQDLDGFRHALAGYGFLPAWGLGPLVALVPGAEAACAGLLVSGATRPVGGVAALALLAAFTAALAPAVIRGTQIDCGCFGGGGGPERASWTSIARNGVLASLAAIAVTAARGAGAAPAALSGVGVGIGLLVTDRALALFREHWLRPEEAVIR